MINVGTWRYPGIQKAACDILPDLTGYINDTLPEAGPEVHSE